MLRRHWETALLVLALILSCAVALVLPTRDPDLYFHLALGREIAQHGSVPHVDLFSYSRAGQPVAYVDVLSALVFERVFTTLGFAGLLLLKLLALLGVALGSFLTLPQGAQRAKLTLVAAVLVLGSLQLVERPALASLAGLSLVGGCLVLSQRRNSLGALAAAGVTCVAWAFLHRFAALGFGLLTLFVGVRFLRAPRGTPSSLRSRPWLELGIVCVAWALVGLTPFGFSTFESGRAMLGKADLRAHLTEWQAVSAPVLLRAFPLGSLLALTAPVLLAIGVRSGGDSRRLALLGFAAWLPPMGLALTAVRFAPYLIVVSILIVTHALGGVPPARGIRVLAALIGLGATLARRPDEPWRLGESEKFAPAGALSFARQQGLSGRVVNAVDLGGYLIWHAWPALRVLVDSRNEAAYPVDFMLKCFEAETNPRTFAAMRTEDEVTWAIGTNEPGRNAFSHLRYNPNWALVYFSDAAVVWVHGPSHPELASARYRFVDPVQPQLSVAAALLNDPWTAERAGAVRAEIARMAEQAPNSTRVYLALSVWLHVLGKHEERDQLLEQLARIEPAQEVRAFQEQLSRLPIRGAP